MFLFRRRLHEIMNFMDLWKFMNFLDEIYCISSNYFHIIYESNQGKINKLLLKNVMNIKKWQLV